MRPRAAVGRRVRGAALAAFAFAASSTHAWSAEGTAAGERASETGLALRAKKALGCGALGDEVIDDAVVLVRAGRIERIEAARTATIPPGYEVVDLGARWICPGFVDLHCHIAGGSFLSDINDLVYLANSELRVSPAVVPDNPDLRRAVAGGVTSVLFIPGSGSNLGGQGVLLKTGLATYEAMQIRNPGSLKLAQAGNPERWAIGVGRSLMNWNTRDTMERGVSYARAWEQFDAGQGAQPERNLMFDVFRDLRARRTQISTHTQRYQLVLATLTMVARDLQLPVYIDHGEWFGSKLATYAEELGVAAIVGPREADHPSPVLDTDGKILGIAASYQQNGHTQVGFNTDSPVVPQEELAVQATVAVRLGFDDARQASLRGLTIVPARTSGIDGRVGSLAAGKDADLLVVDGDPIDPRTTVHTVFIEGERVYDAAVTRRRW